MEQDKAAGETKMAGKAGRATAQANDHRGLDGQNGAARRQLDEVVLSVARLMGRRMAREHFTALSAANDNRPPNYVEIGRNTDDGF